MAHGKRCLVLLPACQHPAQLPGLFRLPTTPHVRPLIAPLLLSPIHYPRRRSPVLIPSLPFSSALLNSQVSILHVGRMG